jgi:hypothetical protein
VPLIDPRTGLIDRAWYLFFLSLNNATTAIIDDSGVTFSAESTIASVDAALDAVRQELQTQPSPSDLVSQMAEMQKQIEALEKQIECPCTELTAELQKQVDGLQAIPLPPQSTVLGVGGSNTQLQYNNAGTLDGAANLQYDGTNLGVGLTPSGSALLQVAAGSITKAPFELTTSAGAVMTVPDDGSFEYDGSVFYATPNANNRGVTVNEHFVARTGTKTMTSNTSLQAVFSGGSGGLTNGALTVNGSTSYYFECSLNLSSMSTTSGNLGFSIVGAGTATFTSAAWHSFGKDFSAQLTGSAIGGVFSNTEGATGNITTAGTGNAFSAIIKGIFRINAAGTIIPSVQLTTASAAVVGADCWFKCNAIGTDTVVSVGNWS